MSHIALLFPSGTDPRSPYLALPSLAAAVKSAGFQATLIDLDIGGLHYLLRRQSLEMAASDLRRGGLRCPTAANEVHRLSGLADTLPFRAPTALAALRDTRHFFDPNEFQAARQVISDALDLHGAASGAGIDYGICPIRYDVEGVDTTRLCDLIRITADDRANLFKEYWESELYPRLFTSAPDIIGISLTNRQQMIPSLFLARRLKSLGFFVALGGALITKFASRLDRLPDFFEVFADIVVLYEGETALCELAARGGRVAERKKIPNLQYLERGAVRRTVVHVENVDGLPCPDFSGLPLDQYLTPEPVLPILMGKGCYFNRCKFCDIPYINHVSRKAYRVRSAEHVADDVLQLARRFGCRHFAFTDEALAPRLLNDLVSELDSRDANHFSFVGYARLEPSFTGTLCQRLARVGFRKLFFGLESGAQRTLDHMNKGIRLSDARTVLRNCANAGIRFHLFSMIGFPEEEEVSARETLAFFERNSELIDHPGNSFDVHSFGLELRTPYFQEHEALGIAVPSELFDRDFVIGAGRSWTNLRGLSHEDVDRLLAEFDTRLRRIYRRFHAGPENVWPPFEEFAVLYGGRFASVDFPFRSSLPAAGDPRRYRLRWNPAGLAQSTAERHVEVISRFGRTVVDRATFDLVADRTFRTVPRMLSRYTGRSVRGRKRTETIGGLRDVIDEWLAKGLVQLEPAPLGRAE